MSHSNSTVKQQVRRVATLGVSLAVFAADWAWSVIRSLTGKTMPSRTVVLYYHSVPKEQKIAFARQMDSLIRCSQPQRADAIVSDSTGFHYSVVTFDDGYQNILESALPELEKRGIPATIFVVPGALGVKPNWEDYSGGTDSAMHEPIMTEEQLRKLPSDLVQIGSHTLTHPMLPQLAELEARTELSVSRARLEQIIGKQVTLFSFPYGSFDDNSIQWCRDEGYERVFTTVPRVGLSGAGEFVAGRVAVEPGDWTLEFFLKLHGAYRWLASASVLKRGLAASFGSRKQQEKLATS
jgi:peptidoglycan/xylan/chitin deacetylase (PgdA/CDA1 family)